MKENFHTFYNYDRQCSLCKLSPDSQEHCLTCPKILEKIKTLGKHIEYKHIFGSILDHIYIARRYIEIINTREAILEEEDQDQDDQDDEENQDKENSKSSLPWAIDNNGPSTNWYIRK